jgi:hypothetical protein
MSQQSSPVQVLSVVSAAALSANRFVTTAGAVPAAAATCLGVAQTKAVGAGERIPVTVLGTEIVEFGAAVAAGAAIECDVQGRAITLAAGVKLGRLAPDQAAITAAGQFGEVILIPN